MGSSIINKTDRLAAEILALVDENLVSRSMTSQLAVNKQGVVRDERISEVFDTMSIVQGAVGKRRRVIWTVGKAKTKR